MLSYVLQRHNGKILIPFMNYSEHKQLIKMRGELQAFFKSIDIEEYHLLFFDAVFDKVAARSGSINVFLVDHNEPSIVWELKYPGLHLNVTGIIDHHVDVCKFMNADPRLISPTGSCSTLVIEHLQNVSTCKHRLNEAINWLVYPLVLDTICFQRDTDLDQVWGRNILLGKTDGTREELQAAAKPLMTCIDASLVSDDQFKLSEVLYKDYKLYWGQGRLYGISTIRVDIDYFIEQLGGPSGFTKVLLEFMNDEKIGVLCITVAVRDPATHQFYQQIGLISENPADCIGLKAELEAAGCILVLIPKYSPLMVFYQNNPKLSRKQIQPAMHKFMLRK